LSWTVSGGFAGTFSPVNNAPALVPFNVNATAQTIGGYKVFRHNNAIVASNTAFTFTVPTAFYEGTSGSKFFYKRVTNGSSGYTPVDLLATDYTQIVNNSGLSLTMNVSGVFNLYFKTVSPDGLNYNLYDVDVIVPNSTQILDGFVLLYKGKIVNKNAGQYPIAGESTCYNPADIKIVPLNAGVATSLPVYQAPTGTDAGYKPDAYIFRVGTTNYTMTFDRRIGTSTNYMICRPEHLQNLEYGGCDKNFVLMQDLNMSGKPQRNLCNFADENKGYSGVFEGNNKTISNLIVSGFSTVNGSPTYLRAGLFGTTSGATIRNLNIENIENNSPGATGALGALVGIALSSSIINMNIKNAVINSQLVYGWAGGIIGDMRKSSLKSSVFQGAIVAVTSNDRGNVLGGAVGWAQDSEILNCQVTTSANGLRFVRRPGRIGGLVGVMKNSAIIVSKANVTIFNGWLIGGLVGAMSDAAYILDSHVQGTFIGDGDMESMGGLVGEAWAANSIRGSTFTEGTLRSTWGAQAVGGLVGNANNIIIERSFVKNITISSNAGGLVGRSNILVLRDCYVRNLHVILDNTNNFDVYAGGILGSVNNALEITRTYVADYKVTGGNAAAKIGIFIGTGVNGAYSVSLNSSYYAQPLPGSTATSYPTAGGGLITSQLAGYVAPQSIVNIGTVTQTNFANTGTNTWFNMPSYLWVFVNGNWPNLHIVP
jgi:hypothetical protein